MDVAFTAISILISYLIFLRTKDLSNNQYNAQYYSDLINEYNSTEFGLVLKRITDFWIDDCFRGKEIETSKDKEQSINLMKEYCKKVFDFEPLDIKNDSIQEKNTLHFSRRKLYLFYWTLYLCLKSCSEYQRSELIKSYFNKNEMNFFVIIKLISLATMEEPFYRNLVDDTPHHDDNASKDDFLKYLYIWFQEVFRNENKKVLEWELFVKESIL